MPLVDDKDGHWPAALTLGSWTIDGRALPGVIAEIGVNHDGRVDRALALIDGARAAGASAAKFQVFRAEALVSPDAPSADYQRRRAGTLRQRDLLNELELADRDWPRVVEHCAAAEMTFLATPFGVEDVARVVDLGAPALKIASTDIDNVPLLEAAVGSGLPLLISTGASRLAEIDRTMGWLTGLGARDRTVLLHCVSSYPTQPADACLSRIDGLARRFSTWVGYSDHTTTLDAGAVAVGCGARVIEKHLTHDRTAAGPDHACSLEAAQLAEYVRRVQAAHQMMGQPRENEDACEGDVRRVARKSIVAQRAIAAGERLTADMLTCRRPANGVAPSEWHAVLGRVAACAIASGTPLQPAMLRP